MKKFVVVSRLSIVLSIITLSCCDFAPGSYPYAEEYKISCSEPDLANIIEKFKEENPEYQVPVQTQLKDGRRDENDHWYHIYFYYKEENEIVKTWIRKTSEGTSILGFVSINEGLTLGKWKEINKDYSKKDNKFEKDKFERLILNGIKKHLQ